MITRTFHPIGQGAFYSERIDDKTIVYDCGVWHQDFTSKRAKSVVKNAFPDNHKIDILFISHFDFDHVSLVPLLLESYEVKAIVIPLLADTEKMVISQLLEASDLSAMAELSSNPSQFSALRNISVFQVRAGENPNPALEPNRQTIQINPNSSIETQEIDSGTILKINNNQVLNWEFIPFNHEEKRRSEQLEEQFNRRGIDLDRLIDPDYFKDNRKEIRDAYASIEGNVNENSLFVYSGPKDLSLPFWIDTIELGWHYYYPDTIKFSNHPGCIYTGDGDLNKVKIHNVYKDRWSSVGTIQIPHHGSKKSFECDAFKSGNFYCPVCFGDDNSYGHPSGDVLVTLERAGNRPILVSEKASSIWIQNWELEWTTNQITSIT